MRFLEEIVDIYLSQYASNGKQVTIVFPNRRAGLFFNKFLSERISSPIWAPQILSVEDFIGHHSRLDKPDKLELIYQLYNVFRAKTKSKEEFDRFYYWGNILLQDFDELDKFMIDPELLFRNLEHVKKLEGGLDYLDAEQQKWINEFWSSFKDKHSAHQKSFIGVWDKLLATYREFRSVLFEKGMGYEGMIYRQVAEGLSKKDSPDGFESIIFAGFNALSKSEEAILSWYVGNEYAQIFWDADDHYLLNNQQEAGRFLREMKYSNPTLRQSFKETYGNRFKDRSKKIVVCSTATDVGQAQLAAQLLRQSGSAFDERTAIILPGSELLFPILHALPANLGKLNITMGYPLSSSAVFGFLNTVLQLHLRSDGKSSYHCRPVLSILRHPLLVSYKSEEALDLERRIVKRNSIWIRKEQLVFDHELLNLIFHPQEEKYAAYLRGIIQFLISTCEDSFEKEFLFHFYKILNRLEEFTLQNKLALSGPVFQKLFTQMVQSERLPFEGEPLLGLQVMGILESRNLDFDRVFILSVNEGILPPPPKTATFVPHSLRKAFGMPVVDQQDAMYAYIFYRLIQRAKNVFLINNSSDDAGRPGELSRFVRQIEHETNFEFEYKTSSSELSLNDPQPITIEKSDLMSALLAKFTSISDYERRLTPTALSAYLDCRLRFYFRYVMGLKEEDEIAEEVDPMVFGNILHQVMEALYSPFDKEGVRTVSHQDFERLNGKVKDEIQKAFARQFGSDDKDFKYEGQNLIAREIIEKMIRKVLAYDEKRAPFHILGLEARDAGRFSIEIPLNIGEKNFAVGLKGIIDRIEEKDGIVRIIDYKTGTDKKNFSTLDELFDRQNKQRNKAVFQTLFYCLLYSESGLVDPQAPIQASLFNIRELFTTQFSPLIQKNSGKQKLEVQDVRTYLQEFRKLLQNLLAEIFDDETAFEQTDDLTKCRYCPYVRICNR